MPLISPLCFEPASASAALYRSRCPAPATRPAPSPPNQAPSITGIRAHFHRTAILVDGELFEPEVGVWHVRKNYPLFVVLFTKTYGLCLYSKLTQTFAMPNLTKLPGIVSPFLFFTFLTYPFNRLFKDRSIGPAGAAGVNRSVGGRRGARSAGVTGTTGRQCQCIGGYIQRDQCPMALEFGL